MLDVRKLLGWLLIILGIAALLLLALNAVSYLTDFTQNPIHRYLISDQVLQQAIDEAGGKGFRMPEEYMRIVALAFGFLLLKLWLSVGCAFIRSGRQLLSNDVEVLKTLLDKVAQQREQQ